MNKKLVIFGVGEFAQIAYEYFTHDSDYEVVAFTVNKEYVADEKLYELPVVPFEELTTQYPAGSVTVFVGIPASDMNRSRKRVYNLLKGMGYNFASYISSKAFVWHNAKIGENTFVFEGNVIQPFVTIGNNCILWSGNHVGHRTIIKDHCFLTSHAVVSGYCEIGEGSFIGVNSTLNDNIKIGKSCLVGSGSLIVKNTEDEKIYVGSPARAVPGKTSFDAGI